MGQSLHGGPAASPAMLPKAEVNSERQRLR